ncbi:hypothetical protein JTB14_035903 [Gonioctena quinquepunctata]|nr:hypothetical protein JTB14_035903 [Gonioctena quinquepunctata]
MKLSSSNREAMKRPSEPQRRCQIGVRIPHKTRLTCRAQGARVESVELVKKDSTSDEGLSETKTPDGHFHSSHNRPGWSAVSPEEQAGKSIDSPKPARNVQIPGRGKHVPLTEEEAKAWRGMRKEKKKAPRTSPTE